MYKIKSYLIIKLTFNDYGTYYLINLLQSTFMIAAGFSIIMEFSTKL